MAVTLNLPLFRDRFTGTFNRSPERIFFCPGRINLIGEHIDYLGGTVLPAAIDRGIVALVARRDDMRIRLRSVELPDGVDLDLKQLPDSVEQLTNPWTGYPTGMIRMYADDIQSGFDILFASNLPIGSGLSSSAAMEVLAGFTVQALRKHSFQMNAKERMELALQAQSVENNYIGVQCGIMDQVAVALGRNDHAIHLDTETLKYDYIPFTASDSTLLVLNSNRPRKLSESKYNERRSECERALATIRRLRPDCSRLTAAVPDDLAILADEPLLMRRTRHAITKTSACGRQSHLCKRRICRPLEPCLMIHTDL